jgi:hypothetical protein
MKSVRCGVHSPLTRDPLPEVSVAALTMRGDALIAAVGFPALWVVLDPHSFPLRRTSGLHAALFRGFINEVKSAAGSLIAKYFARAWGVPFVVAFAAAAERLSSRGGGLSNRGGTRPSLVSVS